MSEATSTARKLNRRRLLLACAALVGAYTTPAWAEGETGDPAAKRIRTFCDALVAVMDLILDQVGAASPALG